MSAISNLFSRLRNSFLDPPQPGTAQSEDSLPIKEIERYELDILNLQTNSEPPSWDLLISYYEAALLYQQIDNHLKACTYLLEYAEFVISYPIYRNNPKNRNFGKEAPQNFLSGASDHCRRQDTSEDKNSEVKPTQPKTDSSGCFVISPRTSSYNPLDIGELPTLESTTHLISSSILSLRRQKLVDQELEALHLLDKKTKRWETSYFWKYVCFHCYPVLVDMYLQLGNIPKVIACYSRLAKVQRNLADSLCYFQKALKVCQERAIDPAVLESARKLSQTIFDDRMLRAEQYENNCSSTMLMDFSQTTVETYNYLQMPLLAADHLILYEKLGHMREDKKYFCYIFRKAANYYLSANPPQFREAAQMLQGGDFLFAKRWVSIDMLLEASECYGKMMPPHHIKAAKCFIWAANREPTDLRTKFLHQAMTQLHEAKNLAATSKAQGHMADQIGEMLSQLGFFSEAAETFILAAKSYSSTNSEARRKTWIQAADAYAKIKEYKKAAQCWEKSNETLVFYFYSEDQQYIRFYWEKALTQSLECLEQPNPIDSQFMDAFLLLSRNNRTVFLDCLELFNKETRQNPKILHTLLLNTHLKGIFSFFSNLSSENKDHFPTVYRLLKMGIIFEKKESSFLLALQQFSEPFQQWVQVIELPPEFSCDIAKQKAFFFRAVILFLRKEKQQDLEQQSILFFQQHTKQWKSLKLLNHHHFLDFAENHLQLEIFPQAMDYLIHSLSFPGFNQSESCRKYIEKRLPDFLLSGDPSKIALKANKFSDEISRYSFGPDFSKSISSVYEKMGMYFLAAKHLEEAPKFSISTAFYMKAAKLYLQSISLGCEEMRGDREAIYAKARKRAIKCLKYAATGHGNDGRINVYEQCLELFAKEDEIHKKYRHLLDLAWAKEVERFLDIKLGENYPHHWLWKIFVRSSLEKYQAIFPCLSLVKFPARQHEKTMSYLIDHLQKSSDLTRKDIFVLLHKLTPSDAGCPKMIEAVINTYFLVPEKMKAFSNFLELLNADQSIQVLLYTFTIKEGLKIQKIITDNLVALPVEDRREAIDLFFLITSLIEPQERSSALFSRLCSIPTAYRQDCVNQLTERWDDLRDLYRIDTIIDLLKYPMNWKIPESKTYWIDEKSKFLEPTKLLLELRAIQSISGRFPKKIHYAFSEAVDVGGVTRDCIARLFKGLYDTALPTLGGKREEQGIIPQCKILENQEEQIEQIKCYEALGLLFAFALDDERTVRTGAYFHPVLFQMLHDLTSEDLNRIQIVPPDLNVDKIDSISVYNKLLRFFLQTSRYKSFFGETDIEINTAIDELIQDSKIPPSLQTEEIETKEAFLEGEGIHEILCATLCIAAGINDYHLRSSWEVLKGLSYKELALNIQGSVDKQLIVGSLKWDQQGSKAEIFLIHWIHEATEKDIQQFLHAISGSFTLPAGRELSVHVYEGKDQLPTFHTCDFSMDLSNNYLDYPTFARQMATALEWIDKGGFSAK